MKIISLTLNDTHVRILIDILNDYLKKKNLTEFGYQHIQFLIEQLQDAETKGVVV